MAGEPVSPSETAAAVRRYAAGKHFDPATIARWLAAEPTDGAALLALAERLRLGENQFRDLFDDLIAIAARGGGSAAEVVAGDDLRAVLARGLGRNETVKAAKRTLRRLRYPQLAAAEAKLKDCVAALALPAGARVELPENLEGEEVVVTIRGRSAAEVRGKVQAAGAALQNRALDEIFALIEGRW